MKGSAVRIRASAYRGALSALSARPAWVSEELSAAWETLAPLLDEVEQRELARDFELWRRVCKAVQAMSDAAESPRSSA
jgi:hypothetical protein